MGLDTKLLQRLGKLRKQVGEAREVRLTMPLFIRLLEFAREDAKEDLDLHRIADRVAAAGARCLGSNDYPGLVPQDKMNQ